MRIHMSIPTTQSAPDELKQILLEFAYEPATDVMPDDVLLANVLPKLTALIHARESQLLDRVEAEVIGVDEKANYIFEHRLRNKLRADQRAALKKLQEES